MRCMIENDMCMGGRVCNPANLMCKKTCDEDNPCKKGMCVNMFCKKMMRGGGGKP